MRRGTGASGLVGLPPAPAPVVGGRGGRRRGGGKNEEVAPPSLGYGYPEAPVFNEQRDGKGDDSTRKRAFEPIGSFAAGGGGMFFGTQGMGGPDDWGNYRFKGKKKGVTGGSGADRSKVDRLFETEMYRPWGGRPAWVPELDDKG